MGRSDRHKPLVGGIEISGATYSSSGTLGAVVLADNKKMILTNTHVVCDPEEDDQRVKILQLMDLKIKAKAMEPPCSAELWDEIRKDNLAPVFQAKCAGGENKDARIVAIVRKRSKKLDAALCEIVNTESSYEILADPNFSVKGVVAPQEGMIVMKSGKQTGITYGKIKAISDDEIIIFSVDESAQKVPISAPVVQPSLTSSQLGASGEKEAVKIVQTDVSAAGDSGSVWVSAEEKSYLHAVGLLYKGRNTGKDNYSVAKAMRTVKDALKFDFE